MRYDNGFMNEALALYIHIPFCVRKCLYCAFNSTDTATVTPTEYAKLLVDEMEARAEQLPSSLRASTLYFGGGTPSLLEPESVGRIIEAAARLYPLESDAEITVEANPGTVNDGKLAAYRAAGVNRLSLGVQSFDDRMLERLGRVHTSREAREAFAAARRAGFANISIDLIHSLSGEDVTMWHEEMRQAVALRPEHISAYGLTIEEKTPYARLEEEGELALPDEEESAAMFEATGEFLVASGYEQYEISNFALPGQRSRHNQVYWQRGNYLGFGAGAHSFLRFTGHGVRWKNYDDVDRYLGDLKSGRIPEEWRTLLTEREAMAEWLFLGLRMLEGIEMERFRAEFGVPLDRVYAAEVKELCSLGLLEAIHGRLRLAPGGVILSNRVFEKFL